jgi:hypothetical protein
MLRILLVLSGCCLKTEVFKQLCYTYKAVPKLSLLEQAYTFEYFSRVIFV